MLQITPVNERTNIGLIVCLPDYPVTEIVWLLSRFWYVLCPIFLSKLKTILELGTLALLWEFFLDEPKNWKSLQNAKSE